MEQLDTILYLDDDESSLELFETYFNKLYRVFITSSISEAEEILSTIPVKVLISDNLMPEETGLEFIERINPRFPDIPKIIFTAYTDYELVIDAVNKAGVYMYVTKPWNAPKIKSAIDNAISAYNLRFENHLLIEELKIANAELNDAFQTIKKSEGRFRSLFANSLDGIYLLNNRKEITVANGAFLKLFNIDNQGLDFSNVSDFITRKYPLLVEIPYNLTKNPLKTEDEIELNDNQNQRFFAIQCQYLESDNDNISIVCLIKEISEKKWIDKRLLDAVIRTQEEEQTKYARELHDGLGPILSTLKMHLEWIANPHNSLNKDKIIQHSILSINEAINNVKEIAYNLSPHILLQFGLNHALTSHLEKLKITDSLQIEFKSNLKERLDQNIETNLYRIVLECINNTIKHSGAKSAKIKIKKTKKSLFLGYIDYGEGFVLDNLQKERKGMGIFNIINRIKHLNGSYKIYTYPKKGFKLAIIIEPLITK